MTAPRLRKRLALGLAALGAMTTLSACGNDPQAQATRGLFTSLTGFVTGAGKKAAPGPTLEQQVATALSSSDAPAMLLVKDEGNGILLRIGENGPYEHYATSARQILTLRRGMIVASRGLGNDLMSSEIDASLALVSARRAGQARRIMRYLDGEDELFRFEFTCDISVGGTEAFDAGLYSARVTTVTEDCRNATRSFKNVYKVAGDGDILVSNQWLAPIHGNISLSQLRR